MIIYKVSLLYRGGMSKLEFGPWDKGTPVFQCWGAWIFTETGFLLRMLI